MKRLILIVLGIAFILNTPVTAQQAGVNIPVLPVVTPSEAPEDWWTLGDGFLQRQVEPTIAASTLNPDHLLAFFNDYRAIDAAEGDVGLGEGELATTLGALTLARLLLPPPAASTLPHIPFFEMPPTAATEAWIGGSRSYDGGLTWSGFYVPGATWADPDDPNASDPLVSQQAPIYGMEAATDPVLAPGPCGTFYLAFVAFTRGDQSKMVVARYLDTNDFEGGETFVYDGMTVVETGNNAEYGYFLDKPDIEVDVMRPADPDNQCAHRVYVTYSTFNGLTKKEKVQTKMNFASATVLEDEAPVFDSIKINKNLNQNQGSAIAVDPRPGEPRDADGGGTVYVFWRHFFDPNAIIVRKSENYGARWSNPEIITSDMAPFDQPTIPVGFGRDAITFRSNAFPTATVTSDGRVFAAWQERVNPSGEPDPSGSPRIVMMRSADGGGWEGLGGGPRTAIDMNGRNEPFDPGLVTPITAPHTRFSGPQVMPKLSFGGGQPMLSFYESRGWIAYDGDGNEYFDYDYGSIEVGPEILGESWMSGYYRVVDLRAALLDKDTGELESQSIQVSRYPISGGADLADGTQDLEDVAPVNAPCSPYHDHLLTDIDFFAQYPEVEALNPCVRQVNRINSPHSDVGKSAFAGDYTDLVPYVQFILDPDDGWRWATQAGDVPTRGFHSIWTDNRHLIPPQNPDPLDDTFQEWNEFGTYGAPNSGASSCANPGSRNADVLTARINSGLVISAPTTFKQLDAERSFPFTVGNQSNVDKFYEITTTQGELFSKLNPVYDEVDAVRVMVFPYSSTSQLLTVQSHAQSDYDGPFKVEVRELVCGTLPDPNSEFFSYQVAACGFCSDTEYSDGTCQYGSIVFNAYTGNDPVGNLDPNEEESFGPTISNAFVINYNVPNAFVINDGLDNAFVINDSLDNAFVINAFVINAFVINTNIHDVIDVVWEMEPGSGNTASSYLPLVNIDFAEQFLEPGNYAFQLIVDKPSAYGTYGILENCNNETYNVPQGQILSNVVQNPSEVDNAFVINKSPQNAFVINETAENAFVINAFVINSTFPMAPTEGGNRSQQMLVKEMVEDDPTMAEPPSNKVRVTLRAYQLRSTDAIESDEQPLFNPSTEAGGWMPSNSVANVACGADGNAAACFALSGPDLLPLTNLSLGDEEALELDVDGTLTFGAEPFENIQFGVFNDNSREAQGATDAVTRGLYQYHGFYVTGESPSGNPVNVFVGDFDTPKTLYLGESKYNLTNIVLEIPDGKVIEPGDYTLVYKVDHPLQVSEYDETNNTLEFPIVITDPNMPPVADDQTVFTDEEKSVDFTLTGSDPDGDALTFTVTSQPLNGGLTGTAPNLTYTPAANYFGEDSFTFEVNDGKIDSEVNGVVTITINPVNDPPVVDPLTLVVDEDIPTTGTFTITDPDNDSFTFETINGPLKGSVEFSATVPGQFTYEPIANLYGGDSFTVIVYDGSATGKALITITINAVNDPPVAVDDTTAVSENSGQNVVYVLVNDSDIDGEVPVVASVGPAANGTTGVGENGGSVTYSPDDNFIGTDTFDYVISDILGATSTAKVTVSVVDLGPNWDFSGLARPWKPNYSVNVGSAIPLKWYYIDPATGAKVDSSMNEPQIRIIGPWVCNIGETDDTIETVNDPGSSDLRYVTGDWQFNWDTVGLDGGCYNVRIYHPHTGQVDGPFRIRLK